MNNCKKIIVFVFSVFTTVYSFAGLPEVEDSVDCNHLVNLDWVHTAGGVDNDAAYGVCADNLGNVYVTGLFYSTLTIEDTSLNSAGETDMFLIKFTQSGELIWAERGGGTGNDKGVALAADSEGNVFVTGTFFESGVFGEQDQYAYGENDIFIAKYSPDGLLLWFEAAGGWENDEAADITIDANDNIIVAGNYENAMAIGTQTLMSNGGRDYFVAKFASGEQFEWASNQGSVSDDYCTAVATDLSGNVFVGGSFSGTMVAGGFSMSADGLYDGFIASYTPSGAIQWMVPEGTDADNDLLNDISVNVQGYVVATGYFQQSENTLFVSRYSNNGILEWRYQYGASAIAEGMTITSAVNGDIYVGGQFSGVANFGGGNTGSLGGNDLVIVKLNAVGNFIWGRYAGSAGSDGVYDICLDYQGSVLTAGTCNAPIYIEGNPYASNGQADALLIRFQKAISIGSINFSGIACDENNLCVEFSMLAGIPPYSYYWSTGDTQSSVCGLSVGNYSLTVVDQTGCFADTAILVSEPEVPVINLPATLDICPFDTVILHAGANMDSYLWTTGATTESIQVTSAGNFGVTVINNFGCENAAEVSVSESVAPNIILSEIENFCFGDTVTVSTIDSYIDYSWSNGANTQSIQVFSQGDYFITVHDAVCVYFDTIAVEYFPYTEVDLGEDQFICEGDSIVFDAGEGFSEYLWQNSSANQTFTAYVEGAVMVTVTDVNSCTDTDSIYLSYAENPSVDLGNDTLACADVEVVIDAGAGFSSYVWSDESTNQTLSVNATGTYAVTVTNEATCSASDDVYIEFIPSPVVDLGDDLEFCAYNSQILSTEGEFLSYLWSTGVTSNTISVNTSGTYALTVTDGYSCTGSDEVEVLAHQVTSPDLGEPIVVCDTLPVSIEPADVYESYLWSTGSNNESIVVEESGIYRITVTDDNSCSSSGSIEVVFAEPPILSEVLSTAGTLIVEAAGGNPPYLFSINGVDWQHGTSYMQLSTDTYDVFVRDSLFCTDTISVFVDNLLTIPEFFTPNGDGYNDTWEIGGIYQYPNAQILIFDRYGKKLVEYKGSNVGWNGTYAGQIMPSDTYWYIIIVSKQTILKGPVTLTR